MAGAPMRACGCERKVRDERETIDERTRVTLL